MQFSTRRGLVTLHIAVDIAVMMSPFGLSYGWEAAMYVQASRLKIVAVVYVQLTNSRSPERYALGDFLISTGGQDEKDNPSIIINNRAHWMRYTDAVASQSLS